MIRIRRRTQRPVRYVRIDVPSDRNRCETYLWQTDREIRFGDTVTGVPGWGRVVVVDDPAMRHGVQHVPVAAPGWVLQARPDTMAR